jgi:hypothetical protein
MQVDELLRPFPIKEFHPFPRAMMGPGAHEMIGPDALNLDLSRVWRGWPLVDGAQDFDHGFLFGG